MPRRGQWAHIFVLPGGGQTVADVARTNQIIIIVNQNSPISPPEQFTLIQNSRAYKESRSTQIRVICQYSIEPLGRMKKTQSEQMFSQCLIVFKGTWPKTIVAHLPCKSASLPLISEWIQPHPKWSICCTGWAFWKEHTGIAYKTCVLHISFASFQIELRFDLCCVMHSD